jgi:hypothetical protein
VLLPLGQRSGLTVDDDPFPPARQSDMNTLGAERLAREDEDPLASDIDPTSSLRNDCERLGFNQAEIGR